MSLVPVSALRRAQRRGGFSWAWVRMLRLRHYRPGLRASTRHARRNASRSSRSSTMRRPTWWKGIRRSRTHLRRVKADTPRMGAAPFTESRRVSASIVSAFRTALPPTSICGAGRRRKHARAGERLKGFKRFYVAPTVPLCYGEANRCMAPRKTPPRSPQGRSGHWSDAAIVAAFMRVGMQLEQRFRWLLDFAERDLRDDGKLNDTWAEVVTFFVTAAGQCTPQTAGEWERYWEEVDAS